MAFSTMFNTPPFLLPGVHISQANSGPNVVVVNTARLFKSVKDIVDYAKAHPGKLDYGFTHAASGHMAMELFKQTTGIYMTGILYRGGGPMLTDLWGVDASTADNQALVRAAMERFLRPVALQDAPAWLLARNGRPC